MPCAVISVSAGELRVFPPRLDEDRNIGIGFLPKRQKILVRLFRFERLPEIAAQKDQPWPTYEKAKTDFKSVNEYIASKAKDVWVILNNARIPDSPC